MMVFAKLCIFTMILQGATALRLREGATAPHKWEGESVCSGPHAQQLIKDKGTDKKLPKVAWVIAEALDRFPYRHTERMRRLAQPLEGADVFVAADVADMNAVEYLPKATRVGIFNYSFPSMCHELLKMNFQDNDPKLQVCQGSFFQFIRLQEAMNLIKEQEAKQGWKYDMIFRMRTEMIVRDVCREPGPVDQRGCQAPGALLRVMAAEIDPKTIIHAGDWYELGFREELMKLAQEFRFPLTEQGFTVSCETDKDKGSKDVRQCVLESNKENQKKVQYLSSPNPRKSSSLGEGLELRSHQSSTEGQMSEAEMEGQMEDHVMRCIDRLGYDNRFNGRSMSAGDIDVRRFHHDYKAAEIQNHHSSHDGCHPYPDVGDA